MCNQNPLSIPKIFLNHIVHADCLTVLPKLPNESIGLVVTDPPYLVNYKARDGRRCGGDNTDSWLTPAFSELYRVLKPDSFCATFYGWPWADIFMQAWKRSGFRPVSHLVWIKSYRSRAGYTASRHEVGFLLAKGRPPKPQWPSEDVLPWEYTGNALHPNQKPIQAITPLIQNYSSISDIVLDPFAGSGSVGVAAAECGRQFILIEKDPTYYSTASERLRKVKGSSASLA